MHGGGLHARNVPVGPGYLRLFRCLTGEQLANRSRQGTERSSAAEALLPQPGGFAGVSVALVRVAPDGEAIAACYADIVQGRGVQRKVGPAHRKVQLPSRLYQTQTRGNRDCRHQLARCARMSATGGREKETNVGNE